MLFTNCWFPFKENQQIDFKNIISKQGFPWLFSFFQQKALKSDNKLWIDEYGKHLYTGHFELNSLIVLGPL